MISKTRIIALLILLTVSIMLSGACGKKGDEMKVTLYEVTHSIFYTPQYVALSKGFFEEEGLSIELVNGEGGDKTMTALLSGSADIVLVGAETAIYVNAQNPADPAVGFALLSQTDGSFLVSRTPIENFTWDMLKGKVLLGQRKGGMPEMVSEFVQKKNGIKPFKDVEIIQNVAFANLGPAFLSGTGDFVQLFEPVASQLEVEGKGYVVASFGKDSGKLPYTIYITKKSTIDNNKEMIQKFTNAIFKAQKWVMTASDEEILEALRSHFPGVSDETILKVIDRYRSQESWATSPVIEKEIYQNLEAVMESAGELKTKVPYEEVINTEFAKKAVGE